MVRGITSIRVESEGSTAGIDARVFTMIAATLQDISFLQQYTSANLSRAQFDRSIGGNLVIETDADSPDKGESGASGVNATTVALVAVILVVVLAGCLLGIYYHRQFNDGPAAQSIKERLSHVQAKRRSYFQTLEDDPSASSGWMVTDAPQHGLPAPQHTATWSDLTSDSESIISVLPLDRIDEEETIDGSGADGEEVEVSLSETTVSVPSAPVVVDRTPMQMDHLSFIAHWNIRPEGGSELASSFTETEPAAAPCVEMAVEKEAVELDVVGDPFWLQEEVTPVRSNRSELHDTPIGSALRGCEFVLTPHLGNRPELSIVPQVSVLTGPEYVYEHAEPLRYMNTINSTVHDDSSSNSSVLEISSDECEDDDTTTQGEPEPKLPMPLSDLTNSTVRSEVESPTDGDDDPQLADWARGVLDKLTSGSVQLLTCGTENSQVSK
jgi:hypothetical protein